MKLKILILLVCTLLLAPAWGDDLIAEEAPDNPTNPPVTAKDVGLEIGTQVPDFTLPEIYGGSLTLYEEMGDYEATFLHFFYANGG